MLRLVFFFFLAVSVKAEWGDPLIDLGTNYTCDPKLMAPSKTVPTSVHSLRPADIKLVMALGDSLTAANGAGATDPLQIILQYRGLAFLAGGDKGLANHITVPNILSKYNPNLFGQSHGICAADVLDCAYLNIAQPGAKAEDLPGQAQILVKRFTDNDYPNIDIDNDWKLLNIFIGGNDVCTACRDPNTANATEFAGHISDAIQIIHDNIPRVVVNLVTMLHLEIIKNIDNANIICWEFHAFGECKCDTNQTKADLKAISEAYETAEMALQNSGIFDDKEDFTLINQVFFNNATAPPQFYNGTVDLRFFAPDCFHFSQYGHAIVSSYTWNNMLQPTGQKNNAANLSIAELPLACPDPTCPFIRTTKNSENCAQYWTPSTLD